jgi:hypothetical protein
MNTYEVRLKKTIYQYDSVIVRASSEEEAEVIAWEEAVLMDRDCDEEVLSVEETDGPTNLER